MAGEVGHGVDPRLRRRLGIPAGALTLAAVALVSTASAHAQAARPRPAAVSAPATTAPGGGCRVRATSGTSTLTLRVGGRDRLARVHVPRGYDPEHSYPLVVNLHGTGATAAGQESASQLSGTADAHGFLVAYPQGLRRVGTGFAWNVPGTPAFSAAGADEAAFVRQLVTTLRGRYCVDPARVYAVGFSGGGRMVSQLACEPGSPFAAVAVVGGLRAPAPCPAGPVPVLGVHGSADTQNPYNGHGSAYWTYSVPEAARRWAVHNGCSATPTVRTGPVGVGVTTYGGCRATAGVELYTLAGKGHGWPAPRAGGFVADEVIWRFFSDHRLPAPKRATGGNRTG
jgi:polyhydroxybutyrate depolymerase